MTRTVSPGLELGAVDRVRADALVLDHGHLLRAETVGAQEIALRDGDVLAQRAVDVDAEQFERGAAVGLALAAGDAHTAKQVGADHAHVAGLEAGWVGPNLDNLAGDFVAQDAGIAEERLAAAIGVQIGAADADTAHADEGFAGAGGGRGRLRELKLEGFGECESAHGSVVPGRYRAESVHAAAKMYKARRASRGEASASGFREHQGRLPADASPVQPQIRQCTRRSAYPQRVGHKVSGFGQDWSIFGASGIVRLLR